MYVCAQTTYLGDVYSVHGIVIKDPAWEITPSPPAFAFFSLSSSLFLFYFCQAPIVNIEDNLTPPQVNPGSSIGQLIAMSVSAVTP